MSIELISFIASSVATFIFKMYANAQADKQEQFKMLLEKRKIQEEAVKSAREFQPNSYVRRFISVAMISVFLYIVSHTGEITYLVEEELPSYFFGLFGGGTELVAKKIVAPVLTKDFTQLIYIIIGYYFGSNLGNRK